ncbi:hypothetical protein FFI97_019425 [Variovorax sp. KBS0712]|uniref:hypothetical protein n=1 Tax=Variovorax sp. KBS0712 TaxID=2578111 RepID=UPI001117FB4C|nr:hypothetical protein [Variovorax sp. KBS0712]TSD56405.1 hypothetical protein FFI97_019425 [Variovorax sp. KBS0712]
MSSSATFPWTEQLEKTVVSSLCTSFGLDFLLFKDKLGGDVDTVHNVRGGVYATQEEQDRYTERDAYDPKKYHEDAAYKERGRRDKAAHLAGDLQDIYRQTTMKPGENRDLDHVISSHEVHHDAGRVLAEIDGTELANRDSNLVSTVASINRPKQQKPVDDFTAKLSTMIRDRTRELDRLVERQGTIARNTPEEQHQARELDAKIEKRRVSLEQLKQIDVKSMRRADREAREAYNQEINQAYYTSCKFLGGAATAASHAGVKLGMRQMFGLIMAEFWFELRARLPEILEKARANLNFSKLLEELRITLHNIWQRLVDRFRDFLAAFKESAIGGALSSITTTMLNMLVTTQAAAMKIIREMWSQLTKAVKLLAFNPDKLSTVELAQAVTSILSLGIGTVIGAMVHAELAPVLQFPFGAELAAFGAALVTGLVTLCLEYFLLHSAPMQKVWALLKGEAYAGTLEQFQAINAMLDKELDALARIEFGLDAVELEDFASELQSCNDELMKSRLLQATLEKRGIEVPFRMGDAASTRLWLASLSTT